MDPAGEAELLYPGLSKAARDAICRDLFSLHEHRLRRMIQLRIHQSLRGQVDPADVIREAYEEAARRLDEYLKSPPGSFFVWLRSIVEQTLRAIHRRQLGSEPGEEPKEILLHRGCLPRVNTEVLASGLIGRETAASRSIIQAGRQVLLQEALNRLDPADREVIVLKNLEHLSTAEIAQVLGTEEATARKRYLRALAKLETIFTRLRGEKKRETGERT